MLKTKIRNIEFNSPIIAASGTFGYGDEVKKFVDLSKLGCVITKSITLEPFSNDLISINLMIFCAPLNESYSQRKYFTML